MPFETPSPEIDVNQLNPNKVCCTWRHIGVHGQMILIQTCLERRSTSPVTSHFQIKMIALVGAASCIMLAANANLRRIRWATG